MRKLYDGTEVPTTIQTDERVFKIVTFDDETVLCNIATAKKLLRKDLIKKVYHLWDYEFKVFPKVGLKAM